VAQAWPPLAVRSCRGQKEWFEQLCPGVDLYPIGEDEDGNASLGIDGGSRIFMLFDPMCVLVGVGAEALANLIEGCGYEPARK
jgi:hypothetical protein